MTEHTVDITLDEAISLKAKAEDTVIAACDRATNALDMESWLVRRRELDMALDRLGGRLLLVQSLRDEEGE